MTTPPHTGSAAEGLNLESWNCFSSKGFTLAKRRRLAFSAFAVPRPVLHMSRQLQRGGNVNFLAVHGTQDHPLVFSF